MLKMINSKKQEYKYSLYVSVFLKYLKIEKITLKRNSTILRRRNRDNGLIPHEEVKMFRSKQVVMARKWWL